MCVGFFLLIIDSIKLKAERKQPLPEILVHASLVLIVELL